MDFFFENRYVLHKVQYNNVCPISYVPVDKKQESWSRLDLLFVNGCVVH